MSYSPSSPRDASPPRDDRAASSARRDSRDAAQTYWWSGRNSDGYFRRDVPSAVLDSPDWVERIAPGMHIMVPGRAGASRFNAAVQARVALMTPFRNFIPVRYGFDLAFTRFPREAGYVSALNALLNSDADAVAICAELLCFAEPLVWGDRGELGHYRLDIARTVTLPMAERRWERQTRHTKGVLVPTQCREVEAVAEGSLATVYLSPPSWFATREDSYSGRAELPPILSYRSFRMWDDPSCLEWYIFQAEWAALRAADLLFAARSGKLLWMSDDILADIRRIGAEKILGEVEAGINEDLEACLKAVLMVDWDRTSQLGRRLPAVANDNSPIFKKGGDWVLWNTRDWKLGDDVPLREGDCDSVAPRETVRDGRTGKLPQHGHPNGMTASRFTSTSVIKTRTRPNGISIREFDICARVIRAFIREDDDLGRAITASGVRGGCAAHPLALLQLLKTKLLASGEEPMEDTVTNGEDVAE